MEETKKMAEKKTNNEQQLFVQKEPFEYNGKTYNRYFIKGMVRGRTSPLLTGIPTSAAIPCLTSCSATRTGLTSSLSRSK